MSKIKAHVAISLDGYIAHTDGETNWIPEVIAKEISDIFNASHILLTGSNTYNSIFEQYGRWPYKNTYVVSKYDSSAFENDYLKFLFEQPIESIRNMKYKDSCDITVMGGGNFITSLINNKLLDELNLYIVPVLLGDGIRLFGKTFDTNIKCVHSCNHGEIVKMRFTFN